MGGAASEVLEFAAQGLDLLAYLVTHRERVVTKEELFAALWPDTFVQDANLPQTVSVLRRALGEPSSGTEVIATVPRRGYQFVAPARAIREDPEARARAADLCAKGRHQLSKRLTDSLAGVVALFYEWDWLAAERAFHRASPWIPSTVKPTSGWACSSPRRHSTRSRGSSPRWRATRRTTPGTTTPPCSGSGRYCSSIRTSPWRTSGWGLRTRSRADSPTP